MRRGALFIREAAIDWDVVPRGSYLRDIPALKGFDRLAFDSNVTFFAGENGTGKSTLLEGIAVAYGFNPEGGTRNYHFSTYQDVSELEEAIRLSRAIASATPAISSARRASSMSQRSPICNIMTTGDCRTTTPSPTARASCPFYRTRPGRACI